VPDMRPDRTQVKRCVWCRGEGTDPRYGWNPRCPVCRGKSAYRYEWKGNTYIFHGPAQLDQRELDLD